MQNVEKIFALWSTDADMARDIGVSYPAVAAWKRRGSIPAGYWQAIVAAARRRGATQVTADTLAELHAITAAAALDDAGKSDRRLRTLGRSDGPSPSDRAEGHFSRFKHLRRSRFASADEIVDHVRALRDEWDRR